MISADDCLPLTSRAFHGLLFGVFLDSKGTAGVFSSINLDSQIFVNPHHQFLIELMMGQKNFFSYPFSSERESWNIPSMYYCREKVTGQGKCYLLTKKEDETQALQASLFFKWR